MDILAKRFVQNQVSSPKPLLSFVPATFQGITPVIYKGDGIASFIAFTIASKISHNCMLSYLARKLFTSTTLLSHFSHTAYGNARRESSMCNISQPNGCANVFLLKRYSFNAIILPHHSALSVPVLKRTLHM